MKKRVFVFILFIILLVLGSIFIYVKFDNKPIDKKENKEISFKLNLKYPKFEKSSVSLIMVGDCLIHGSIYDDAKENGRYNFYKMVDLVKPKIKEYDLAFYNQESILGGTALGLSSYPTFNSPQEVGDAFIDMGFNLVSLANNHTLDRGEKAITNSVNYWNSKSDVLAVGSYLSNEDRDKINIKEKNNITYTMLNYTYGTNGIKVPTGKDYLVNVWPCTGNGPSTDTKYQEYKNKVKEDINRVRNKVDLLIVAMHWGVEYTHTPTSYQIDMANFLEKQGVDIIIGTHPHVVMPVTYINDTLVIYSLGNFLSAQETNIDYNTTVGLLSTVKITKHIDKDNNTSIKLSNQTNELIYTYSKNNKDYKVIPFSNPDIKTYLSDYERVYNKYASVIKNMDNTIEVNSIN